MTDIINVKYKELNGTNAGEDFVYEDVKYCLFIDAKNREVRLEEYDDFGDVERLLDDKFFVSIDSPIKGCMFCSEPGNGSPYGFKLSKDVVVWGDAVVIKVEDNGNLGNYDYALPNESITWIDFLEDV